ncbi:hypothetical protein [Erwinia sorbitola]|uniref:Flagellar protein FliT n=1 Tax=Erwinia sorbitola TaxID=2681984 RepID=A0A6I6EF76_9GAMM|nr:hypothetical protein [Erwinia sorbitola]QGU88507.1 hypothetical protein GN242_15350 [Erwinia sorbitola]
MTSKRILQLNQALEQAAFDENWNEIRRVDAQISDLLRAIREQGLYENLHHELDQLRRSHARVAKMCREQHDLLRIKLQQYQQNREGLQAYEMFSASDEENE